ncbi:carboxylesterase family protein [Nakamurella sp. YIM 132087]|uniref:Carboxylic ester hydrolase n=2 Tax=Nakamurella alba TaxID=2665158 RepID=A0A7K1FRY1_9ACTN|nr:carboxylesterase family protein [Nakamurella alba]
MTLLVGCSGAPDGNGATGALQASPTSTSAGAPDLSTPATTVPTPGQVTDTSSPDPADAPVDTTTGTLRGKEAGATHEYLGIRFASPPTGARRWTLPEPAPDTDEVLAADAPGPACPQSDDIALAAGESDEDCLFLNVTVPTRPSTSPRPVMVWWHGGGFTSGSGSQYDARRLADQGDVVVVTANYRLGMFGYLALPGLPGSGNFGFADQLAALAWAKGNATAFGGDPDNITVFGESAGGTSVCAALTSPAAAGLIDKAIFSSGSCRLSWPAGTLFPGLPATASLIPLKDAETIGVGAAKAAGCDGSGVLDCLRRLPVATVVDQAAAFGNPLAYGTDLLPERPADAVVAGRSLPVPVISGGNLDEQRSFVGGLLLTDPDAVSVTNYGALVRASFGEHASAVLDEYPLQAYDSAALAWSTLVTDVAWACTTTRGARELAAAGATVYSYEFADRTAPDVSGVASSGLPQGAAHATDLPYLFDLGGKSLVTRTGQGELAETMVELWTSFARTGTPSSGRVASWPATTGDSSPVLQLGNPDIGLVDHRAEHKCAFWESVGQG